MTGLIVLVLLAVYFGIALAVVVQASKVIHQEYELGSDTWEPLAVSVIAGLFWPVTIAVELARRQRYHHVELKESESERNKRLEREAGLRNDGREWWNKRWNED